MSSYPYRVLVKKNPRDKYYPLITVRFGSSAEEVLDEVIRGYLSTRKARADYPYQFKAKRQRSTTLDDLADTAEALVSTWIEDNPTTEREVLLDYMKYNTQIPSTKYDEILDTQFPEVED